MVKRGIFQLSLGSPIKPSRGCFLALCLFHILGSMIFRLLFIQPRSSFWQGNPKHCKPWLTNYQGFFLLRNVRSAVSFQNSFCFLCKVASIFIKSKILTSNCNCHYGKVFTCRELKINMFWKNSREKKRHHLKS